jgi:integrase
MKAKKQIELSKKDKSITRAFKNHLVFSVDGESKINVKLLYKIFYEALQASEVKNIETRGPVPYSFRHHFITSMINRGANPTQVAETCGTSTHEIEKTYYHTTDKKMLTNALQNFDYVDGLLIPKGN